MNQSNMTPFFLLYLFTTIIIIHVKAQTLSDNTETIPSADHNSDNTVQPNLAVVIGMLSVIFALTFILLLYAKFCHHDSSAVVASHQIHDGLVRARAQESVGVDKTVVESLPFFRFSSLKGSKNGLECAVCLAKFEDVEVLRLLPKCKHAFHIGCIDQWLEKRVTCPLCRQTVSANDVLDLKHSTSSRFLWNNQTELREESNVELHVEREESIRGSRRFSVGSSFRKLSSSTKKEEELPIQLESMDFDGSTNDISIGTFDKFKHKIVVSDVATMKYRWSNVSSSDLMSLNSEMINDVSSSRFSSLDSRTMQENEEVITIKEDFPTTSNCKENPNFGSKILNPNEKRSMSEIVVHPRFMNEDSSFGGNNVEEDRMRSLWLPIARKTVQWFANREKRPPKAQELDQTFNV